MTDPLAQFGQAYGMDPYARHLAMEALRLANAADTGVARVSPSVGGPVTVPALSVGATASVVVPFTPPITASYVPIPSLYGTSSLLGGLSIAGVSAKTSSSVTVMVRAEKLAVAAGATVSVVCFRTA
jgi:hypothetical protein